MKEPKSLQDILEQFQRFEYNQTQDALEYGTDEGKELNLIKARQAIFNELMGLLKQHEALTFFRKSSSGVITIEAAEAAIREWAGVE